MERPGERDTRQNPYLVKLEQQIMHEKATETILKYEQTLIEKIDKLVL